MGILFWTEGMGRLPDREVEPTVGIYLWHGSGG